MNIDYTRIIIIMIFMLVIGAGTISLQVFMSRKVNKWLGFILPIITFSVSLVLATNATPAGPFHSVVITFLLALLWHNIPTAILIIIYAACIGHRNKQRTFLALRASDKMNAPDVNNLMLTLSRGR